MQHFLPMTISLLGSFSRYMFVVCQLCDEPLLRAWECSLNRTWIVEMKMGWGTQWDWAQRQLQLVFVFHFLRLSTSHSQASPRFFPPCKAITLVECHGTLRATPWRYRHRLSEWTVWHLRTRSQLLLALTRVETLTFAGRRMRTGTVILSDMSQL